MMDGCHCMNSRPNSYRKCQKDVVMFVRHDEPAIMGDDVTNPPVQGKYRNVLSVYESNGHAYLYDSGGLYTKLTIGGGGEGTKDFNKLDNRPRYAGRVMTSETNIPDVSGFITGINEIIIEPIS